MLTFRGFTLSVARTALFAVLAFTFLVGSIPAGAQSCILTHLDSPVVDAWADPLPG